MTRENLKCYSDEEAISLRAPIRANWGGNLLLWLPLIPILIFIILTLIFISSTNSYSNDCRSFNVGYKVIDMTYQSGGRAKTLTMAIWYPTRTDPAPFTYGGPSKGNVALDAPPLTEGSPWPLFVFSHGYGGSGLSAVFLTEAIASRGWIVAAPDHNDRYSAARIRGGQVKDLDRKGFARQVKEILSSSPEDREKYLYRIDEMKLVLDEICKSGIFGHLIDKTRIAVGGHSFGGFTALGLCGTIKDRCYPNIKAVLLFSSGAGGYLFREEELASVKIPSMYFLGEWENGQMRGELTMKEIADKIYRNLPSPKYFLEVKGANHFSFNNSLSNTYTARLLSGTQEQFEVVRLYSIAFLEKYVAGKKDAKEIDCHNDPILTKFISEPTSGTKKK